MAKHNVLQIALSERDILRLLPKVGEPDSNGCRRWLASLDNNGYGQFRLGPRTVKAHLVTWTLADGEFPDGLEADHLCNNRDCVEPSHLEWVTHEENCRRVGQRSTMCRAGLHSWDEQIPILVGKYGDAKECRPCRNERKRLRYATTGKR